MTLSFEIKFRNYFVEKGRMGTAATQKNFGVCEFLKVIFYEYKTT
jgi:hypothetical protein